MTDGPAFYEEARRLDDVIQHGLRYHRYYDPDRHILISVLVPGQLPIVDPTA